MPDGVIRIFCREVRALTLPSVAAMKCFWFIFLHTKTIFLRRSMFGILGFARGKEVQGVFYSRSEEVRFMDHFLLIHGEDPSVFHEDPSRADDGVNLHALHGVDKLASQIIKRVEMGMIQVNKNEIGLFA